MPLVRLICLANAKKMKARCVAGIDVEAKRWIRPVGNTSAGELHYSDFRMKGGEPKLLDLIQVPLSTPKPSAGQPENWLIEEGSPWTLLSRPAPEQTLRLLRGYCVAGPNLFGDTAASIAAKWIAHNPAAASLALVQPADFQLSIGEVATPHGDEKRLRADFQFGGASYHLPVTDPVWLRKFDRRPPGQYGTAESGLREVLLTVSLGEPFYGYHYKLVAAIIRLNQIQSPQSLYT